MGAGVPHITHGFSGLGAWAQYQHFFCLPEETLEEIGGGHRTSSRKNDFWIFTQFFPDERKISMLREGILMVASCPHRVLVKIGERANRPALRATS
jgi:hypothetical protein